MGTDVVYIVIGDIVISDKRGGEVRRMRRFMREYGITIAVSAAATVVFRLLLDWLL